MSAKVILAGIAAALGLAAVSGANAGAIYINFDAVTTGAEINGFYDGGTDSSGASGPNLGVGFVGWATATGFGETSQPNLAYNADPSGIAVIDDVAGFSSGLRFTQGLFSPGTVSVFSGPDGTGALLAFAALPTSNPAAFAPFSLPFLGTAESVVVDGAPSEFGIDDLYLGAIPEPATWAMLILGLLGVGATLRARKSPVLA